MSTITGDSLTTPNLERPPTILDWIKANPNADVNDLGEIIDNWYISGHGKDRPTSVQTNTNKPKDQQ